MNVETIRVVLHTTIGCLGHTIYSYTGIVYHRSEQEAWDAYWHAVRMTGNV